MDKLFADVGETNFKFCITQILRLSLDKERVITNLQDTTVSLKKELDVLEKKTIDINENLVSSIVKEKRDLDDVKSKIQELSEVMLNKTRLIDFKLKQIEGDSVSGDDIDIGSSSNL